MSGGNLHALMQMFTGVIVLATATAARAEDFATGVAVANIAWARPAVVTETMTDIAAAGFRSVRVGLKNPLSGTFHALDEAKAAGLQVLVTIPLIDGAVATKAAIPRQSSKHFFAAYGLKQVDLGRYEDRLSHLLDYVIDQDIPLIGLEIGNELNWSGYNGDLTVADGGMIVAGTTGRQTAEWDHFDAGLTVYREILERTRSELQARPGLAAVKIVSAGLADINVDFIRRVGATYVTPRLTYEAFAAHGLFELVDVVGIHIYEPLRVKNISKNRIGMVTAQLRDCGRIAFGDRPCWITEFGAALPKGECDHDGTRRIALMQPLLDHLASDDNADRVPIGFYYDWNDDGPFSLVRCGETGKLIDNLPRTGDTPQNQAEGTSQ